MSLIARHLEENGIATAIMGCALDIVEHCGVPRFLFSDFPLGNSAGKPHEVTSQRETLDMALDLFDQAVAPRTTVHSPQHWQVDPHTGAPDDDWKLDFMNVATMDSSELQRRREEFEAQKSVARTIRTT